MEEIIKLFPNPINKLIIHEIGNRWTSLQEIRFRISRPVELIFDSGIEWINRLYPTEDDGIHLLNQLSQFSLYRLEEELREGFITIEGGHRIGLSGRVNTENGCVKAIKNISSFNIRIAKEKIGAARSVIPFLYDEGYQNTLIIGPPQSGKTTLLRDTTRLISSGWGKVLAQKTGVIDERSEIGGSIRGIPQHDLGIRTDLLDACPKAEGMMMMIRSMSPEVLVVDEIGGEEDVKALMEAVHAGVQVICTVHGHTLDEIRRRPSFLPLFQQQTFRRFIVLERHSAGIVRQVLNNTGENIYRKPGSGKDEVDWGYDSSYSYKLGRD
ncbi:stage III sporulation protein AA [Sediminibacillus massiliensis]|uniref:stage III sporulation protein AA n=1 Tax=Sediminibacillus massiliensis TaxID=1926277 RepID=UPI0009883DFC|nr:stage III sporulation protein AA [Sediminibacillus massiliensis]